MKEILDMKLPNCKLGNLAAVQPKNMKNAQLL